MFCHACAAYQVKCICSVVSNWCMISTCALALGQRQHKSKQQNCTTSCVVIASSFWCALISANMIFDVIFQAKLPPCEHIDCIQPCQCSDVGCWLQEDPVTGQKCHACGSCIPNSIKLLPFCLHIQCLQVFCDSDQYSIHTIPGTNKKCRGCKICNGATA